MTTDYKSEEAQVEIEAGGTTFGYDDIGEGRVVVLLHGLPSTRLQMKYNFEPIFSQRSGWRRIYPDLPGMGTTPGGDHLASQDAMLDALGEFVDRIVGDEPIVLVGASYGGYLALGYNHRWGSRLAGFMLTEPMVKSRATREVPDHTVLVENPALVASLQPDEHFWTQVAVVQSQNDLDFFREAIKPGFLAADHAFLDRLAERIEYSFDIKAADPLTAPGLILAGRQDSVTGYRDIWEILERFPRTTLAILDRAGHSLTSEQETLFTTLTHEFLDRVEEHSR